MQNKTLNYRFYNPNEIDKFSMVLLDVFIDVNKDKVEKNIKEKSEEMEDNRYIEGT